jgi:hypothetical protein
MDELEPRSRHVHSLAGLDCDNENVNACTRGAEQGTQTPGFFEVQSLELFEVAQVKDGRHVRPARKQAEMLKR